jgi:phosphopantetheinyl transferase (holo-ACP synthase)
LETTAHTAPDGAPTSSAGSEPEGALGATSRGGIGLEIEALANLPDAEDFAADAFYREHFTAAEIAFSAQQPSVKASFAGLLAAKKAIVKAGAAKGPLNDLQRIEIGHDGDGRPTYPGCSLSISHMETFAAAVCALFERRGEEKARLARAQGLPVGPASRIFVVLVVLALIFLFGFGLWLILRFALG